MASNLIKTLELFVETAHARNNKKQDFCSLRDAYKKSMSHQLPCISRAKPEEAISCNKCIFETAHHKIKLTQPQ